MKTICFWVCFLSLTSCSKFEESKTVFRNQAQLSPNDLGKTPNTSGARAFISGQLFWDSSGKYWYSFFQGDNTTNTMIFFTGPTPPVSSRPIPIFYAFGTNQPVASVLSGGVNNFTYSICKISLATNTITLPTAVWDQNLKKYTSISSKTYDLSSFSGSECLDFPGSVVNVNGAYYAVSSGYVLPKVIGDPTPLP
jgi:hypothetical protein